LVDHLRMVATPLDYTPLTLYLEWSKFGVALQYRIEPQEAQGSEGIEGEGRFGAPTPNEPLQVVDLKPIPLAHDHRVHGLGLPGSAVGAGPLGAFAGYVPMAVMNDRGLFFRWAILPGNARETWGRELVGHAPAYLEGLPAVLGDRGFRWVQGVKTPPYRVRGGSFGVGAPKREGGGDGVEGVGHAQAYLVGEGQELGQPRRGYLA